jgi:hypothetical protein
MWVLPAKEQVMLSPAEEVSITAILTVEFPEEAALLVETLAAV